MVNPIDRMSPFLKFLHLAVLVGFAVAQPLYDLLAGQAEFFVPRQTPVADIYLTVVLVSLTFPALLALLVQLAGNISARLQQSLFLLLVAALLFSFCLLAIRQNALADGYLAIGASVVAALVMAGLYHAFGAARSFVTFMAPAILVFPIVFLWADNIAMLRSSPATLSTSESISGNRASSDNEDRQHPPVVMLIFDELALNAMLRSNGEIDAVRYPNFAALAGTATWYRNATTVAPVTNYAVPAILSGRYPSTEALPVAAKYPQTLFSLLRDTHVLNIQETVTRLCPAQSCTPNALSIGDTSRQLLLDLSAVYGHMALPAKFNHWLPPLGHKWGGFVKAANTQAVKDEYKVLESEVRQALRDNLDSDRTRDMNVFLESLAPWTQGKPPLHFLHILVPHRPWRYYPSGTMYTGGKEGRVPGLDREGIYWESDQNLVDQAHQRYLMQVGLADAWLGRIMTKLRESELFSQSLLVVVSDHGASFVAGDGTRKLTETNYESVLPVPLFIKHPGQTNGRADDSNVEITDILPTLAELLEFNLPIAVDGKPIGSPDIIQRKTKRMYDFFSRWENLPLDVDARLPGRAAHLQRRIALFGEAEHGGLYAFGPHKELLGRRTAEFESSQSAASLLIDQASWFHDVDLTSGFVPGLVTGSLFGVESPPSPWVVLALNGVLSASAPLYQDAKQNWVYTGLLPEAGFKQGHNVVELFFVDHEQGNNHLNIAGTSGASKFWLEERESGVVVVYAHSKEALAVAPLTVHGYVDTAITQERSLTASGWAIELDEKLIVKRTVKQLLVFANGRGVAQAPHNGLQRPDILKFHDVANAGFSVELPRNLLEQHDKLEIRIVGVNADGSAGELGYIENFTWRPQE